MHDCKIKCCKSFSQVKLNQIKLRFEMDRCNQQYQVKSKYATTFHTIPSYRCSLWK